jgi:hypothetical protein
MPLWYAVKKGKLGQTKLATKLKVFDDRKKSDDLLTSQVGKLFTIDKED